MIRREYESFVAIPDAPVSISTHVDKASQDLILRFLHERFPDDALCAEESIPGFDTVPKSGPRVVGGGPDRRHARVRQEIGQFSVMIGLLVNGKPVVGVVAEPAQNRVTYARLGGGCWSHANDETAIRCRVSRRAPAESVLVQSWTKTGQSKRPVELLKPARVVETYSGGVKLAMLARGEADVYPNTYETFYDWDICAGHVLVTESGGTVTDLSGGEIAYQAPDFSQRKGLLATNGQGHADVVRKLTKR